MRGIGGVSEKRRAGAGGVDSLIQFYPIFFQMELTQSVDFKKQIACVPAGRDRGGGGGGIVDR